MPNSKSEPPRGVLNQQEGADHFNLSRFHPSSDAAYFVEHYWIVRWDLRGKDPFRQDVLSHPSVHLVFEKNNTLIWGIVTGRFTRELKGKGKVLGIKFRPGAFYPFLQSPVASFTDDVLQFEKVFEGDLASIETEILDHEEDEEMVERAESFLMRNLPDRDPKVEDVAGIVACIRDNTSILKVTDLAEHFNKSERTLQRQFRQYVGTNPKWVIQRYRLHEAAEQLADGRADNWPALALELGYYDQTHFIRDFKSIVGDTPAEYVKNLQK